MVLPVHLLVCSHGLWGEPEHMAIIVQTILETHIAKESPEYELEILSAETNKSDFTYDGIDWCSERIVKEVEEKVRSIESVPGKEVRKFSIIGYSLGGLLARYVIGILLSRGFFDTVTPVNFSTFATPHVGIPRYPDFRSGLMATFGPKLLSRTGEQLYCKDAWDSEGRPLLEAMSQKGSVFISALSLFRNVRIYANAINDITVPYMTGAIELEDPFVDYESVHMQVDYDPKYKPLIRGYRIPPAEEVPIPPKKLSLEYIRSLKSTRPPLPPFLQWQFPLNILLYMALPAVYPVLMASVIIHLSRQSRASKERIRLLTEGVGAENLSSMIRSVEKTLDDVIADLVDEASPTSSDAPEELEAESSVSPSAKRSPLLPLTPPTSKHGKKHKPTLTPSQIRMINSLNSLDFLHKEVAFISDTRFAHAVLIHRDPKRFPIREEGMGAIRHWADRFVF